MGVTYTFSIHNTFPDTTQISILPDGKLHSQSILTTSSTDIESLQTAISTLMVMTITDTSLPNGKHLIRPLTVQLQYDEEEVLVSEPLFHLHTTGFTTQEAIANFKHILVDELEQLTLAEKQLGPRLLKQLWYLRSIIGTN